MKRVLIVEDSITQAYILRQTLEEQNYLVDTAHSGLEAYRALKHSTPDLIILDYLLPDTNGIKLCQTFKQDTALNGTSVIMFSSENKLEYMVKAYEAGADYYIVKDREGNRVLRILTHSIFTRQNRRPMLKSA